jgi:NDP-sugar pyrophosphorylase family protein
VTAARLKGAWGVVLAGAYPRARSAFDRLVPRPLLPVAQTPIVAYPLRWLAEAGVPGATVCANSTTRTVRSALHGTSGLPARVEFHEDWMPRGAAGCVRDAGLQTNARTFIVVDGTTIPCGDLRDLLDTHTRSEAALTVCAHSEPRATASNAALRPNGVYVFDRSIFDHIAPNGFQDIKEALIPRLHSAGVRIAVHEGQGACPRIYDAWSYLTVNRWAISRLSVNGVPQDYTRRGEALVHASACVSPQARLVGPLVLGCGVTVEDNATLVGPTAIGSGSLVARGAVVSRSVVWSNCRLGRDSLVDRCVLSDDALVPPHASLYGALKIASPLRPVRSDGGLWMKSRVWVESMLPIRGDGVA